MTLYARFILGSNDYILTNYMKIYCLLGNSPFLEATGGDKINEINRDHIFGIEYSEKPFGLATTNMLIHGDGNTNVI